MGYRKLFLLISIFAITVFIYWKFNPVENNLFPKCPFLTATGLKCPGCGSQRAIHHLLHFDIASAFTQNAMLVIFIPYIIVGMIFDTIKHPSTQIIKWRKWLFGQPAIMIILISIISFWIGRNIL